MYKIFQLAEKAVALELISHPAICSYLLGVIAYYKGNYIHALQHLLEAKYRHGFVSL